MKLKISKQGVGLCLLSGIVAGSLFLGCSSDTFSDNEFKPSNKVEEKLYNFLKEKYPNIKVVSYEFIDKNNIGQRAGVGGDFSEVYGSSSGTFIAETRDEFRKGKEKYTSFFVFCEKEECNIDEKRIKPYPYQ